MGLNTPLPQPLPKECAKAAKIFKSFVDGANNGLDGVIPRSVLENARGFAIFTIFKAGFLFSARAGSGVVIAKLDDGTWSAPSAIGTAGVGFGGQAGAEMTDFLVVLNSRSAVRSFMSAGSLTLGGNMSIAIGPLGRNGEAIGSLNTKGKVAAMYSYSKTKGLFGGVSIEGSVIVERQDANAQAYNSSVSAMMLLSGHVDRPTWASTLIQTLEGCTGMPGNRRWVQEGGFNRSFEQGAYAFGGVESPRSENSPSQLKKKRKGSKAPFPPPSWGKSKTGGSYFGPDDDSGFLESGPGVTRTSDIPSGWNTRFDSDFVPEDRPTNKHRISSSTSQARSAYGRDSPFDSSATPNHSRSTSMSRYSRNSYYNPTSADPFSEPLSDNFLGENDFSDSRRRSMVGSPPNLAKKPGLAGPLDGIARGIALYDFHAVESGDLSFSKGMVITITEKSNTTDAWWTGKVDGKQGIFPANFVEVV